LRGLVHSVLAMNVYESSEEVVVRQSTTSTTTTTDAVEIPTSTDSAFGIVVAILVSVLAFLICFFGGIYKRMLSKKKSGGQRDVEAGVMDDGAAANLVVGEQVLLDFTPEGTTELNPVESTRSYSSIWKNGATGTGHARSMLDSPQAWSAARKEKGQWMQMDLGAPVEVAGVVMQGRADAADWDPQSVTKYSVEHSADGATFSEVAGVFTRSSSDWDFRHSRETSLFPQVVVARYVRIIVQEWNGHPSIRAGVLVRQVVPAVTAV